MYFKRIEMHGFKSFADPVTIEFKDGITCIVGPNGSGKSNISDAIRWVLGEQSAKTLRGKKMEEVIFSGSSSRRPKGMAEVTLVVDNTTGILPIDYSEVAIRRRVFRSGESEYSINGNICRRRDIVELIMDTGIGVDGYSLIGQGRIADIISENPESRREIFEEAAGVIKYKTQKETAQRKLESANINLDRSNDIILEIEERLPGLEDESTKAKEALELRDKHKELEINITLRNIESIQKKNEILKGDLNNQSTGLEKQKSQRTQLETDITSLRKQDSYLDEKNTETKDKIRINVEESMRIKNSANLNEERQKSIEKDKVRLNQEIESLQGKISKEKEQIDEHLNEKSQIEDKLEKLNEELEKKMGIAADYSADLTVLSDKTETQKNEVFELSREKADKEAEVKSNTELMSNFDSSRDLVEIEVEEGRKLVNQLEEEIKSKENEMEDLSSKIIDLTKVREEQQKKHEKASIDVMESRSSIERFNLDIEKITARKKTIEEMENNYEGYNFGVKTLMKQGINGIEGVVAELMTVPKGYETAIETALGATLQNIITADDASAKTCIEYLKKNKAGRVTLLPISSIKDRGVNPDRKITGENGFDDYAVNIIDFHSKFKSIFGYLLGNVVIVDNLDNAIKLSKKTNSVAKFVTLEGEVINSSGAITGGSYRNKTANLLERRSEIETLAVKIKELGSQKNTELTKMESLKNDSAYSMKRIDEIHKELRVIEDKKIESRSELQNLKARIEENRTRLTKKQNEFASIETDKGKYTGINDELNDRVSEINKKLVLLEESIDASGEKLAEIKADADQANEEVMEIRVKVTEIAGENESKASIVQSLTSMLSGYNSDLHSKESEYQSILNEESRMMEEASLAQEIENLEKQMEELNSSLETIELQRKETKQAIENKELSLKSIEEGIEKLSENKHSMEIEMGKQETRLVNLKDKLYDDFDITYVEAIDYRIEDFAMTNAVKENRVIKKRLSEIGEVNPGSIKEYEELKERYEFQTEQRDDIHKSMEDYQRIVTDMDKTSKQKFKDSFDKIVDNFTDTFKLMFGGGRGQLILENPDDPLESGIEISAQPPGKVIKNISQMSGGEQTMVAIALMFSVLKAKPTPFCILDEVEAALDENNIRRFADYLVNFNEIQFALVTHQKTTMEYADVLYGVTMPEQGITKVLSLKLGDPETQAFAEKLKNQ